MTILFKLFVLPGETVGYDIEATLNVSGSYEYVSRIAVGQDAPNQETPVPRVCSLLFVQITDYSGIVCCYQNPLSRSLF